MSSSCNYLLKNFITGDIKHTRNRDTMARLASSGYKVIEMYWS